MKITNNFNLPGPLYRALASEGYDAPKEKFDMSVTSLISAPRKIELKRRHPDEITEDASGRVWSLLGNSIHYILRMAECEDSIVEHRFYMNIGGWIITGQTDLYEMSGIVTDFKVTSTFTFSLGAKTEHETQLNLNAMLFRNEGFKVNNVQIMAILRDWMQSRAEFDKAYPPTATYIKPYPVWSQNKCIKFAEDRVELHKAARLLPDDKLPFCTDEERWYRGEAFAVIGEGGVKAAPGGVFTVEEHKIQAKSMAETMARTKTNARENLTAKGVPKKSYVVQHRPGTPNMCLKYCNVSHICSQHQSWLKANPSFIAAGAIE
jgi:hypothetical protein